MSENNKMTAQVSNFMKIPLLLTILFAAVAAGLYFADLRAGLATSAFVLVYFIVVLVLYQANQTRSREEMVDYASQYSLLQKKMINELELPYAVLDPDGKLLWMNESFRELSGREKGFRKSVSAIFPELTKERLLKGNGEAFEVSYDERIFRAYVKHVSFADDAQKDNASNEQDQTKGKKSRRTEENLIVLYLFDETELVEYKKMNEDIQLVAGLIYIDNYDEVTELVDDMKQSLLMAMVDRKVTRYFSAIDGLVKKTEKDKYFVVFKRKYLPGLQEKKFNLLEEVKSIKVGGDQSVSLSMGFGYVGNDYIKNYEYARTAMDLALGRGGDQAVVKTRDKISYYGGNREHTEKSTRVKARVKAQALRELMMARDSCYIMGHTMADIDSFGAAVGIYCAARQIGKKAHIVLGEVTTSLKPFRDCFTPEKGYPSDMIISPGQAYESIGPNSVLVVVDTNRPSYTESPALLAQARTVVVFDHHRIGEQTIRQATLSYIEPNASSACEMIAEILQYFDDSIHLSVDEADVIYAGILIDTNNFMSKTGVRTFEAAAYLRRLGVNVTNVRKMMRNDLDAYKARAEAIRRAEVYRDHFAISVCPADQVKSPTIASAQAANELLNIVGIRASFVLVEYHEKIYISSRSIDEINVQRIMERLGGGGHMSTAGAQLANCSVEEAKTIIRNTIDEMIEEGDIKI